MTLTLGRKTHLAKLLIIGLSIGQKHKIGSDLFPEGNYKYIKTEK